MNLLEAIKEAQETGKLFRPISHKGYGEASYIEDGWMKYVDTTEHGSQFCPSRIDLLTGEWEMTSSEELLAEAGGLGE